MTHHYQDGAWSDSEDPLPVHLRLSVWNATVSAEEAKGRVYLAPRVKLFLEVLMVVMCLGAVAGNILVIGIVVATKNFHSVTSVLIINLAISDLLVGVGVMPFVAVSIMNKGWVDLTKLCLYVGYTASVYCTASVLTLAAIALDRYCSIMDCLRYSARCTLWRSCTVVLWVWLQALLTSLPPLLGWSSVEYVAPMYSCAVNWASSPSYTAFMACLSFLLPAAVILFCYVHIVRVARDHARRIHTLEEQLQRSRENPSSPSSSTPFSSSSSPAMLVYHLTGRLVSELHGGEAASESGLAGQAASDAATTGPAAPQPPLATSSTAPPSRLLSFLAQSVPQPLQNQHHHGVLRLFMVIFAFFLCWTPYMGVALVQAMETALSYKSSLVPPSAVTFSYWLVLLNSDINPLLYALLSRRFQGALWCLRQKIGARLGWGAGGGGGQGGDRGKGRGQRSSELCTVTHTLPPDPVSAGELTSSSSCSHSGFPQGSHRGHFLPASSPPSSSSSAPSSSSVWPGGLQVPSRTPEGGRLPFSAATSERQATFFYGQITVRVEHDVG